MCAGIVSLSMAACGGRNEPAAPAASDPAASADIVVDVKNDKAQNRQAAMALAKQVLAGR
jgi:hypothetical protein